MPRSKAVDVDVKPRPVSLLLVKGCSSSVDPPTVKPNSCLCYSSRLLRKTSLRSTSLTQEEEDVGTTSITEA